MQHSSNRYFLWIAYNGTEYHGWQIQPNGDTIQARLEKAFAQVYHPVKVIGSGRTDAKVHAYGQVAHVDLPSSLYVPPQKLLVRLNTVLPPAIYLYHMECVPATMHARFDAVSRSYVYYINTRPNPFTIDTSYFFPYTLAIEQMNQAAQFLLGRKEFTTFCKKRSAVAHHYCNVTEAKWQATNYGYHFHITADRFLHHMVRSITGTLLQVGVNKLTPEDFKELLLAKNRCKVGVNLPAKGLFLKQVRYPTIAVQSILGEHPACFYCQ